MRTLYASFHYPHQWKIAKYLQEQHGWDPVYWMSDKAIQGEVEREFPGVTFQEYILARRAIHSNSLASRPDTVIDKKILDDFSKYQMDAMRIIYRADAAGTNFTFLDLIEHYYDLVKFWLKVVDELKIELFVSWVNPHSCDYVLYLVCKYLNIPILYIDVAEAITNDTHLITNSIENKTWLLKEKYLNKNIQLSCSPKLLKRLEEQRGTYEIALPRNMKDLTCFKGRNKKQEYINHLKDFFSAVLKKPWRKTETYFKLTPGPYKSLKTSGSHFQYWKYKLRISQNGDRYLKFYKQHIISPNLNEKFIYFASPYQPEVTTIPDAGVYANLIIILEMLSKALPSGWTILYKEHPAVFYANFGGDLYRSKEFYEKISSIPSVRLIDARTDSFLLIDKSQAVATATGTVGWEAVVRGKPSLVFAQPWYSPCEGVFQINEFEELKKVLDKIKAGYRPDYKEVERFAGVVEQFCFTELRQFRFKSRFPEMGDIDKEMAKYAKYFYQAYQEYYGNKN